VGGQTGHLSEQALRTHQHTLQFFQNVHFSNDLNALFSKKKKK